ncbi:MAG: ABC transporter permease [Elusimicrobiota bacterium]|jgi:ABC-2 type transport system permease protein|nr:ABC transporter permease [Elusimicrobiota bacterium]
MKSILNIAVREFRIILKSKLLLFLLLAFPAADFLLLGGIFMSGSLEELPIAVIDEDNSALSRMIIRSFDSSADMQVKYRLSNINELKDYLIRQKVVLGLYIPRDFQNNIKRQKPQSLIVFTSASNYITASIADAGANTIIATLEAGIKYQILSKKGFSHEEALALVQQIQNDNMKLFNPALNYHFYLTPGLWLSILHQLLILFGALAIAKEFDMKTVSPMYETANKSVLKVLLGKTIFYTAVSFGHFEILYRLIFPLFGIKFHHWSIAPILFGLCFCIASISLGLLLSSVLKTQANAFKGVLLISAPAFLLSGYTYPISIMPKFLAVFVQIIPLTPFLAGFKKIYHQDLGINYIYPYIVHLLILAIAFFAASYILLRFRIEKGAENEN